MINDKKKMKWFFMENKHTTWRQHHDIFIIIVQIIKGAIETTKVTIFERLENINLWHKHLGWHLSVKNVKFLLEFFFCKNTLSNCV